MGFDAANEVIVDMISAGIIDPVKVMLAYHPLPVSPSGSVLTDPGPFYGPFCYFRFVLSLYFFKCLFCFFKYCFECVNVIICVLTLIILRRKKPMLLCLSK